MKPPLLILAILPLLLLLGCAGWGIERWLDDGRPFPFVRGDELAILLLPDESETRDPDHIEARPDAFEPITDDRYIRGAAGEILWVRLTLHNPARQSRAGVLRQFEPYNDEVVLYSRREDGGWSEAWQGESVPAQRSALPGNQCAFPVTLPAGGATTLYLRIRDRQFPDCDLRWHDPISFTQRVAVTAARDSAYFGFLTGLLVCNLFLYARARQPDRLWYCGYLVTFGAFLLFATNRNLSLGWPLASASRDPLLLALLFAASGILTKVTRSSLELDVHAPRWDWGLRRVGWISATLAIVVLAARSVFVAEVPYHVALLTGHVLGASAIGGAVTAWRKGVPMAPYCVLAFSCLWGTVGIGIIFEVAGFRHNELRHLLIEAGSALEMSILWLAVADRVRRLREDYVRAQQTALEETRLNGHKSAMMRLLSHDLRGPLAALDAGLDEVAHTRAPDHARIGRLRTQTQDLRALVEGLLDNAALERGRLELHRSVFNLSKLVADVVAQHTDQAGRKGQRLVFEPSARSGNDAWGDPARLRQVLVNLIDNALKFTPIGGTVRVRIEWTPDSARVEVEDTGPGLHPDDFGKLFAPYQSLSARPTAGEPSTGLGLYFAHQIVTFHAGRMIVTSQAGGGATFGFELPLRSETESGTR